MIASSSIVFFPTRLLDSSEAGRPRDSPRPVTAFTEIISKVVPVVIIHATTRYYIYFLSEAKKSSLLFADLQKKAPIFASGRIHHLHLLALRQEFSNNLPFSIHIFNLTIDGRHIHPASGRLLNIPPFFVTAS